MSSKQPNHAYNTTKPLETRPKLSSQAVLNTQTPRSIIFPQS